MSNYIMLLAQAATTSSPTGDLIGEIFKAVSTGGSIVVVFVLLWGFRGYLKERDNWFQTQMDNNNNRFSEINKSHQEHVEKIIEEFKAELRLMSNSVNELAKEVREQGIMFRGIRDSKGSRTNG